MTSEPNSQSRARPGRERRRAVADAKDALRELQGDLGTLSRRVGTRLRLNEIDLECLDVLAREKVLSPSALATRLGLHRATITGVLDRLERGQWIVREPDPADRRAMVVRPQAAHAGEIFAAFKGMNDAVDGILADYSDAELDVISGFMRKVSDAGRENARSVG
ncbi:MarR family winged helix-turn-helix transcriptional regulator [Gryllotalpicola protaetiae]|uniref:MarR family transcriptional regulator n=1 Tax=Gryllotalpicola protaetiae TaxID=2419771 RepID=A0A387BNN2_9MICO|nr:MarR family transcriptional regulator [Gryllotalpicola protaetiae]AYG03624.1 MarR family transcriptional regulator [Gryllotalpicola protaetiae]